MKQQSKKQKQALKFETKTQSRDSRIKKQGQSQPKEKKSEPDHNLQHLPTIDQLLSIPADQRSKRVVELFAKVKPFLHSFIQKKQGSRVSQLIFKWGPLQDVKKPIFQSVKSHWKQLIKSKYALYVISKVIAEKQFTLDQIVEDCVTLMSSREAAHVLDNYIKKNPESPQVKDIKKKFIQLAGKANQDMRSQQLLHNIAIKSVQKQYYSFAISKLVLRLTISNLFEEQKQKILDFLVQNIAGIVDDQEGVRLFIEIMNNCSPKHKKAIVKAYKGNVQEIVNFNNVSYVTIIKLVTEIDDTVHINKSIVEQILDLLPKMSELKHLFKIIFALFSPRSHNFNVLGKYEPSVPKTQSKKPQQERKKQIRAYCYPQLTRFLTQNGCQQLKIISKMPHQGKLIVGIIRSMIQDNYEQKNNFINSFVGIYLNGIKGAKGGQGNNSFEDSLICDVNAHKILKNIISMQQPIMDVHCDKVANLLIQNIDGTLKTKASFVLLGIVEKGGRNWILDQLKRVTKKLDQAVAGEHFKKIIQDKPMTKSVSPASNQGIQKTNIKSKKPK